MINLKSRKNLTFLLLSKAVFGCNTVKTASCFYLSPPTKDSAAVFVFSLGQSWIVQPTASLTLSLNTNLSKILSRRPRLFWSLQNHGRSRVPPDWSISLFGSSTILSQQTCISSSQTVVCVLSFGKLRREVLEVDWGYIEHIHEGVKWRTRRQQLEKWVKETETSFVSFVWT